VGVPRSLSLLITSLRGGGHYRELVNALEEIVRLRIKNLKQRQLLIQFKKDSKEDDEDLVLLKVELEEAKKIEDILKR
jgi:hypothetical protein